jgi:hypothetical protein
MSKWKNKDGKTVRRNKIDGPFAWKYIEALISPAYRVMSLSAHRVVDRIEIEHHHHGGKENGRLPVTHQNFIDYGIHHHAVAPAIREAEALGFIRVTEIGRGGSAEYRRPNKFALTHLATKDNPMPTNDWRRIKTVEEAEAIAKAARNAPPKFSANRRRQKKLPVPETGSETTAGKRSIKPGFSLPEKGARGSLRKPAVLSISSGVAAKSGLIGAEPTRAVGPKRASTRPAKATGADGAELPVLTGLLKWTTPTLTQIEYTHELRELYRREMLSETVPAIDLLKLSRGVVATSCIDLSLAKRSN